jgi:AGCS family alanine or glycine:cation symporter
MTRPRHRSCPIESFVFQDLFLRPASLIALAVVLMAWPITPSASAQQPEPSIDAVNQTTPAEAIATETTPPVTDDAAAATDPDAPADSKPETSDAPERELPPWIKSIDSKFGKVVAVLDYIIFFKLYTSPDGAVKIPFVVVWLFGGALFLTIRMGFINFRAFWHAVRLTRGDYDNEGEPGDVSHFQALATALSATVGLGNIAGVAIAIGMGGPGAAFWILVVGLLGMTSKFAECTLAQLYRSRDESGHVLGGPMRYLRVGLSDIGFPRLGRVLAVVFMVLCIGASFGGGNAFQIGQSLDTIRNQFTIFDQYPWVYGLVMVSAVGLVIIGGIKSIGNVASKIVPFMCGAYMLASLYILAANYAAIPDALMTIVSEAFNPTAIKGGFLGVLVIGIQRAVFSNEAGIGSAAIVHSAAKTNEPVSEGIVALLEPFIDTVVVCTCTALVVVITGAYAAPEMASAVARNAGAQVTLHAFVTGGYDWFAYILYVAVVLFAFSTCISWSYYGERCWAELFGSSTSIIYKILFLTFTFLGSIVTRGNVLDFSDLMLLGMALPNLLGVFMMSGIIKRQLDNYWNRYRAGKIELGRDTSAM